MNSLPRYKFSNNSINVNGQLVKVAIELANPKLVLFENFMTEQECDFMVAVGEKSLNRSTAIDTKTGVGIVFESRTSDGMFFGKGQDDFIRMIEQRAATLIEYPVENGEAIQLLRYNVNQQYLPHFDYFAKSDAISQNILIRGGQRIATFLMYLKTPDSSGETSFPDAGIKVKAQKGNALLFVYPEADPSSLTLHGGDPVLAGEKFVATIWFRQNKFV